MHSLLAHKRAQDLDATEGGEHKKESERDVNEVDYIVLLAMLL